MDVVEAVEGRDRIAAPALPRSRCAHAPAMPGVGLRRKAARVTKGHTAAGSWVHEVQWPAGVICAAQTRLVASMSSSRYGFR